MADTFYKYLVIAWARLPSGNRKAMAELEVRAPNGRDAAEVAAADLGLQKRDWDDGSRSPPIVLRVHDMTKVRR